MHAVANKIGASFLADKGSRGLMRYFKSGRRRFGRVPGTSAQTAAKAAYENWKAKSDLVIAVLTVGWM